MNNQMEDLMYRAGLTAQGCWDEMDQYDQQAIRKFAELIVRECAKVSERTGALNGADYEGEMIADAIKEHFGVEE